MQPDTRQITGKTVLSAVGANAQPLLDTDLFGGCSCRYNAGAAVSVISAFGRVDYDLD